MSSPEIVDIFQLIGYPTAEMVIIYIPDVEEILIDFICMNDNMN